MLISRKLYGYHGVVRGGPGRGKAAFLERLVAQLASAESEERVGWLAACGAEHEPSSLVILDLKGEMALFNTARLEAARAGIPFRYFTFHPGQASHAFNFFAQSHLDESSKGHIAQALLQALGAEYGQAYGASFFSSINEVVLLNTLRRAFGIDSFQKLHRFPLRPELLRPHPRGAGEGPPRREAPDLAREPALPRARAEHHRGGLHEAARPLGEPDRHAEPDAEAAGGLFLPLLAPGGDRGAATVARLAIFALIAAAARRGPEDTHRVAVIADEFQTMATRNIARVLEHARSMRVPFVLAHQFREQPKGGPGADLALTVDHCAARSLDFEASTPEDIQRIEKLSLHGAYARPGWTRSPDDVADFDADGGLGRLTAARREAIDTISVSEVELPIYDHNTILELSADSCVAWFFAKMRDGYTQYVGVTPPVWEFHVSAAEHDEIAREPWPGPSEQTIVVEKDPFQDEARRAESAATSVVPKPVPGAPPPTNGQGLRARMKRVLGAGGPGGAKDGPADASPP